MGGYLVSTRCVHVRVHELRLLRAVRVHAERVTKCRRWLYRGGRRPKESVTRTMAMM